MKYISHDTHSIVISMQQQYIAMYLVLYSPRCSVALVSFLPSTLDPIAFLVLTLMVCTVSGVSPSRVYTVPVMVATGAPLCSMS